MLTPNDKQVLKVLWITLFLNAIVSIAKLIYGHITASISLQADGFHSLLDFSSNIVGIFGIILAAKPADEGHPYGHRKIETIASIGISFFLFFTSYELIITVWDRIKNPAIPHVDLLSFVIMGVTIGVNFFVAVYERRVGEKLKSDLLLADSSHTKSDLFVSLSVMASFVGVLLGIPWLDVAIAIGIVVFIFYVGFRILFNNLNVLLDAQTIDPEIITKMVLSVPGVQHCHKVRSRGTRNRVFLDLHIHVEPTMTTELSHELTHIVIRKIKKQFTEVADVLIHTEPAYPTGRITRPAED